MLNVAVYLWFTNVAEITTYIHPVDGNGGGCRGGGIAVAFAVMGCFIVIKVTVTKISFIPVSEHANFKKMSNFTFKR